MLLLLSNKNSLANILFNFLVSKEFINDTSFLEGKDLEVHCIFLVGRGQRNQL